MHPLRRLRALALLLPLATVACGGPGSNECGDGEVSVEGTCVPVNCSPDDPAVCDGPRVLLSCSADGIMRELECPAGTHVCLEGRCTRVLECNDAEPACCATANDCYPMHQNSSCDECQYVAREAWCSVGECEAIPEPKVDYTVGAAVSGLPAGDASRISSMVLTIFPGVTADGSTVSCARLFEPTDEGTLFEQKERMLNPVLSQHYNVMNSGDVVATSVQGMPPGPGQTIVVSVFDDVGGRPPRLGRGCIDGVEPVDGQTIRVVIEP